MLSFSDASRYLVLVSIKWYKVLLKSNLFDKSCNDCISLKSTVIAVKLLTRLLKIELFFISLKVIPLTVRGTGLLSPYAVSNELSDALFTLANLYLPLSIALNKPFILVNSVLNPSNVLINVHISRKKLRTSLPRGLLARSMTYSRNLSARNSSTSLSVLLYKEYSLRASLYTFALVSLSKNNKDTR